MSAKGRLCSLFVIRSFVIRSVNYFTIIIFLNELTFFVFNEQV